MDPKGNRKTKKLRIKHLNKKIRKRPKIKWRESNLYWGQNSKRIFYKLWPKPSKITRKKSILSTGQLSGINRPIKLFKRRNALFNMRWRTIRKRIELPGIISWNGKLIMGLKGRPSLIKWIMLTWNISRTNIKNSMSR